MNRRRGRRAPPPESRGARPRRYGAAAASGDPGGEIGEREGEAEDWRAEGMRLCRWTGLREWGSVGRLVEVSGPRAI
jgi:hypothetical protein